MDEASILSLGLKNALDALSLSGATVVERKIPSVREGEALPLICVSLLAETMERATAEASHAYDGFFPALVTIIRRSAADVVNAATVREWRKAIRVCAMELNVSGIVIDGSPGYEARPPFNVGLLDKGYDYSPQLFVYRIQLARG